MCQRTMLSNIDITQAQKSSIHVAKTVILTQGSKLGYSLSQENEKKCEEHVFWRLVGCVR